MKQVSKKIKIISLRNGVELSLEEDQVDKFLSALNDKKFISLNGRLISTSDIVGIFDPEDMEAVIRRRSGQWQGKDGKWRDKGTRVCPKCNNEIPPGLQCGRC